MGNSRESIERGRGSHRVVDSRVQEAICLVDGATGEHVLPSVIVVEVARLCSACVGVCRPVRVPFQCGRELLLLLTTRIEDLQLRELSTATPHDAGRTGPTIGSLF